MNLICSVCHTASPDEFDCCPCGGRLLAPSIYLARCDAEADRIDEMWSAFHAVKEAEATYSEGALFKRQAS